MIERGFIKQVASSAFSDPGIKEPQQFQRTMDKYEQLIYQQQGLPYPTQPNYQHTQLAHPQPNTLVDHFMKQTFAQDQAAMQQYTYAQDMAKPQPIPPPIRPNYMDHQLGKQFIPIQQNFLDYNANSKSNMEQNQPNYLREVHDTGTFYQNQLQYMQSLNDQNSPDNVKTLKHNIQSLGGIEDTIGNMQSSLNNYEIRHLVNKNIRNYPEPPPEINPIQQQKQLELQQQQQLMKQNGHPFLYNPAEDRERYTNLQKPAQQIYDPSQTYQSQFYNTQQQFQQSQEQFQQEMANQQDYLRQQQMEQQHQQYLMFESIENSKRLRQQKQQVLSKR